MGSSGSSFSCFFLPLRCSFCCASSSSTSAFSVSASCPAPARFADVRSRLVSRVELCVCVRAEAAREPRSCRRCVPFAEGGGRGSHRRGGSRYGETSFCDLSCDFNAREYSIKASVFSYTHLVMPEMTNQKRKVILQ